MQSVLRVGVQGYLSKSEAEISHQGFEVSGFGFHNSLHQAQVVVHHRSFEALPIDKSALSRR